MNITKVAAWSEIVSSVAILATLVYLALQMQQNTAAIHAETRQAMLEGDMRLLSAIGANPEIMLDRVSEDELSPKRKIRLHAHLQRVMRSREYHWYQYQNGVLDETTWRTYQSILPSVLGTKRTRGWWKQVGRITLDPKFVKEVDRLIEGQPYTDFYDRVLAWK